MAFSDQSRPYGVAWVIALLVGIGVWWLTGITLWEPVILAGVATFLISRIRPQASRNFTIAIGLLFGHVGWMLVGVLIAPQLFERVNLDLVVGIGFGIWAVATLSRTSLIAIIVFELLALALNIFAVLQSALWGLELVDMLAHISLRLAIVVLGNMALRTGVIYPQAEPEGDQKVLS